METTASVGLQNATVTKLLLGGIVINSTIASVLDIRELFHISIGSSTLSYHEIWRLGTWQLLYDSFGEVFFSSLALYKLAPTERFMGSKRYAAFVLMALTTTSLLVPSIIGLLIRPFTSKANLLACGLTPTIFAILFQYHALIPAAPAFKPLTETPEHRVVNQTTTQDESVDDWQDFITDKVWVYALAAQLAASRYPTSLIGAATGWFIGSLYHAGYFPKHWRLQI